MADVADNLIWIFTAYVECERVNKSTELARKIKYCPYFFYFRFNRLEMSRLFDVICCSKSIYKSFSHAMSGKWHLEFAELHHEQIPRAIRQMSEMLFDFRV